MWTGARKAFWGLALLTVAQQPARGANLVPGDSSFETGHGAWAGGEIVSGQASDGVRSLMFSQDVTTQAVMALEPETDYVMSTDFHIANSP